MTDDEITDLFESLTPEDFHRDSSANKEERNRLDGFDSFMEEMTDQAQTHYREVKGDHALAVLCNSEIRRTFIPDYDETVGDFLKRLKIEARKMDADWFSIAMVAPASMVRRDKSLDFDQHNSKSIFEAIDRGDLSHQFSCFYASRSEQRAYCTIWPVVDIGHLGTPSMGRGERSALFMEVISF